MSAKTDTVISDILSKDIIDLLGLQNLPKDKQDEYRKLAEKTVNDRAFVRLTNLLEEKGLIDEFENNSSNDASMQEFLSKNDIDLNQLIAEEAVVYKAEMSAINDVLATGLMIKSDEK